MKMLEINNPLIRRKTAQQNINQNKLNISKVNEFKHSITKSKTNSQNNKKNSIKRNSNKIRFHSSKKVSISNLNDSRNASFQFNRAQTQKYFDKTNLKNEDFSGKKII